MERRDAHGSSRKIQKHQERDTQSQRLLRDMELQHEDRKAGQHAACHRWGSYSEQGADKQ